VRVAVNGYGVIGKRVADAALGVDVRCLSSRRARSLVRGPRRPHPVHGQIEAFGKSRDDPTSPEPWAIAMDR
jgi:hypothetical protein